MRYLKTIGIVTLLVIICVSSALAAEPASQEFPLTNGTVWVYEGPVKWSNPGSDDIMEKTMTWNMTITETIERQQVFAATVEGFPLDLAFYEEGVTVPGTYLMIRIGTGQYYMLSGERVQPALDRLRDQDDELTDLVQDIDLFLDLPLESGKIFGETFQLARQDGMYFWNVTGADAVSLRDIEGAPSETGATGYTLSFSTLPDEQQVTFVPGLGFTHYVYNHHGSPATLDLRLTAYYPEGQPKGQSSAMTLTNEDNGTTVELAAGETLEVTLEGNPTTGYIWEVDSVDEAVLKSLGEPDFKAESDLTGAGGMMTLRFEAVSTGTADLKLVYHRPWEKDVEPAETFKVTVTVQ